MADFLEPEIELAMSEHEKLWAREETLSGRRCQKQTQDQRLPAFGVTVPGRMGRPRRVLCGALQEGQVLPTSARTHGYRKAACSIVWWRPSRWKGPLSHRSGDPGDCRAFESES